MSEQIRYDYDDEKPWQVSDQEYWLRLEAEISADPNRDFFSEMPPKRPKQEVGAYVANCGFDVPLIEAQAEWEEAFDLRRAMIRSELEQDYDGYSGLLSSELIDPRRFEYGIRHNEAETKFRQELGALIATGLRSGALTPESYMKRFSDYPWEWAGLSAEDYEPQIRASKWLYIPGTNIRVFRDPHVEGRYHVGVRPDQGYVMGYTIDKDQHDTIIEQERADNPLNAQKVFAMYEAIRTLPRFDHRQTPLMEMQLDRFGKLHFLQYLKTGLMLEPTEEFALPSGDNIIKSTNVRGVTPSEGKMVKLYIAPKKITQRMKGQGAFFGLTKPSGLVEQQLSMLCDVIVHQYYVSMKNNHFSSAPLYRPKVAIGLGQADGPEGFEQRLEQLIEEVHGRTAYDKRPDRSVYINIHVTANGHEAALETDFELHFEENI